MLNQKLDEAETLYATIERAKVDLENFQQTYKQLKVLSEKRTQVMVDSYLAGIEPDTRLIDEAISHLEADKQVTFRLQYLETILKELRERCCQLGNECCDLIVQTMPDVSFDQPF